MSLKKLCWASKLPLADPDVFKTLQPSEEAYTGRDYWAEDERTGEPQRAFNHHL